jgi:folate-binding protein YgfZ
MIKPPRSYPNHLSFIRCEGPDALSFLQGQLTNDIRLVTPTLGQFSAYCNHKGRIITLFHIFFHENCYYLSLPAGLIDTVLAELKKYGAFSAVTITRCDNLEQIPADVCITVLEKIHLGIPDVLPETSLMFTPHELNLPRLGAVSFTKGCYRGQEIIARMEHLGKHKHGMYQAVIFLGKSVDLAPGTDIVDSEHQAVGKLVIAAPETAETQLALVSLKNFDWAQQYFLQVDKELIQIKISI